MNFEEWEPEYLQIVKEFGYSVERDRMAAELLADLVARGGKAINADLVMNSLIRGFNFVILGPCRLDGQGLGELRKIMTVDRRSLATVGEGTAAALKAGFSPKLVFTDLDGSQEDDIRANMRGAVAVIHAHGDNMPALRDWLPRFPGSIIPTSQCRPPRGVQNWGGFTDGDRAFCALGHFGARSVELKGFDFENPCGSKRTDPSIKKRKLAWAKKIISENPI